MPLPSEITFAAFEHAGDAVLLRCSVSHMGARHGTFTLEVAFSDAKGKPLRAIASASQDFFDANTGQLVARLSRTVSNSSETNLDLTISATCGLPYGQSWQAVITARVGAWIAHARNADTAELRRRVLSER